MLQSTSTLILGSVDVLPELVGCLPQLFLQRFAGAVSVLLCGLTHMRYGLLVLVLIYFVIDFFCLNTSLQDIHLVD